MTQKSWRLDKAKTSERGYGWQWQKAREQHLRLNPLCVQCLRMGLVRQGNVVDHIIAHRGNDTLFWDRTNWQTLCATHHNSDKQAQEKSGRTKPTIGPDGYPIP